MSGIFNQLMKQEAEKQKQAIQKAKKENDTESTSDATASRRDAVASRNHDTTSPSNKEPSHTKASTHHDVIDANSTLDKALMSEIVVELSRAEVILNAISIRMSAEEKQYVDDFILDTLRKKGLSGPNVSIAKLMRYAMAYVLLKHQPEFIAVLKKTLTKKDSGKLFQ